MSLGNGFFTETVAVDYLYGLGGVIIGTMLGAYVFKHIPTASSATSSMPISASAE